MINAPGFCVQTIVAVSETNEQIMELANIATLCTFNPRDAMLARVLAMTLCLAACVCLSQLTSRCSIETAGRIGLVFGRELPSTYPYSVYKESGTFKK